MKILSQSKLLFGLFFIFYIFVGYYIAYVLNIYHNDAISRTALGFFTIFGRNPHLGAVGFVWQPLPSLIQVPFLIFLKPFGLIMMAGPAVTAFCGAISVVIIEKVGLQITDNKNKFLVFLISVLFGLNPLIILYSAIGASEMIFMASLLFSSYFLVKWLNNKNQWDLLLASFFISLSFWSRYESIAAFGGCLLVIITKLVYDKNKLSKIESILIQFATPYFYTVALWILANWLIMKNPFYFLNSPYSNTSFTTELKNNPAALEYTYSSIVGSIIYVFKRIFLLTPVVVLFPFIVLNFEKFKTKLKDILIFSLLLLPYLAIIVFHIYLLYKGQSFGWLRFYIYSIPLGIIPTFYLVNKFKSLRFLSVIFIILSLLTSLYAISNKNIGKEEVSFMEKIINPEIGLDYSRTYEDQKAVDKFIDQESGKVLVDTDIGFAIPLFSKNPSRFVITSDIDYENIVKNYVGKVDWIIVPAPRDASDGERNKIYHYYPDIWNGNAPSIELIKEIDGWRIFKVIN